MKDAKKVAPKWGTKEWIAVYPWSKMDRKRKARVRKLFDEKMNAGGEYIDEANYVLRHAFDVFKEGNPFLTKREAEKAYNACLTLDVAFAKMADAAIAKFLAEKWGV